MEFMCKVSVVSADMALSQPRFEFVDNESSTFHVDWGKQGAIYSTDRPDEMPLSSVSCPTQREENAGNFGLLVRCLQP